MPNPIHLILILAFAFGAVVRPANAQPVPSVDLHAVTHLLENYQGKGVTDANIIIARNGVPVFRKSIGLANREPPGPPSV